MILKARVEEAAMANRSIIDEAEVAKLHRAARSLTSQSLKVRNKLWSNKCLTSSNNFCY